MAALLRTAERLDVAMCCSDSKILAKSSSVPGNVPDDDSGGFAAFISRRSGEAAAAALPPYVTEVERPLEGMLAIGSPWTERLFDGAFYLSPLPQRLPACHLVFVQSLDGNTGTRNPQTLGGGETDKHLIYEGLTRVSADAVLAGASTVRGGNVVFSVWHPELVRLRQALGQPRHPVQIIATRRGIPIEREFLYNTPELRIVLLTAPAGIAAMREALRDRPWITPVVIGAGQTLVDAFERLRAMGIDRISAIGGRTLATELIDAGLVQDLYLTTSPTTGGQPGTPIYPRPLDLRMVVRKRGTLHEAGVVFEHSLLPST
jgi:5-amino-6-(5-phosphoribosylamino)uracil reductase